MAKNQTWDPPPHTHTHTQEAGMITGEVLCLTPQYFIAVFLEEVRTLHLETTNFRLLLTSIIQIYSCSLQGKASGL